MQNERMRRFLALFLVVALALATFLVAGCETEGEDEDTGTEEEENGTETEEESGEAETIKIGVHTSLTGGLADYGFAAAEALKLAAEDYDGFEDAEGNVYEIELVIKDDKGEPAEAPVVAQQLVDEGVVAVIGCLTSGNTNASLPIYQEAGIPLISGSATNPDITEGGEFENFFRTCLRDDVQGAALADWAVEMGVEKAVVMDDRGDYAVGLGNLVEENLVEDGVEVQREQCQEGDVDFSAQVNNVKEFAPDALIFTGYHREAGLMRKQLIETGLGDITFMGGDGIKSDEIAEEAGGAENVQGIFSTFGSPAREGMDTFPVFAESFREATGEEPGPYAENNYDALAAVVAAVQEAGSADPGSIIEALGEVTVDGLVGDFTFNEKGDIAVPGATGVDLIPRFEFQGDTWAYLGDSG